MRGWPLFCARDCVSAAVRAWRNRFKKMRRGPIQGLHAGRVGGRGEGSPTSVKVHGRREVCKKHSECKEEPIPRSAARNLLPSFRKLHKRVGCAPFCVFYTTTLLQAAEVGARSDTWRVHAKAARRTLPLLGGATFSLAVPRPRPRPRRGPGTGHRLLWLDQESNA